MSLAVKRGREERKRERRLFSMDASSHLQEKKKARWRQKRSERKKRKREGEKA